MSGTVLHLQSLTIRATQGKNGVQSHYGKRGEISTNRKDNQEMGLLCLHLLQASMVYINTLMIQQVLKEPGWTERMTPRDLAALSPLITLHINPYGRFELNMEARLPLAV